MPCTWRPGALPLWAEPSSATRQTLRKLAGTRSQPCPVFHPSQGLSNSLPHGVARDDKAAGDPGAARSAGRRREQEEDGRHGAGLSGQYVGHQYGTPTRRRQLHLGHHEDSRQPALLVVRSESWGHGCAYRCLQPTTYSSGQQATVAPSQTTSTESRKKTRATRTSRAHNFQGCVFCGVRIWWPALSAHVQVRRLLRWLRPREALARCWYARLASRFWDDVSFPYFWSPNESVSGRCQTLKLPLYKCPAVSSSSSARLSSTRLSGPLLGSDKLARVQRRLLDRAVGRGS